MPSRSQAVRSRSTSTGNRTSGSPGVLFAASRRNSGVGAWSFAGEDLPAVRGEEGGPDVAALGVQGAGGRAVIGGQRPGQRGGAESGDGAVGREELHAAIGEGDQNAAGVRPAR